MVTFCEQSQKNTVSWAEQHRPNGYITQPPLTLNWTMGSIWLSMAIFKQIWPTKDQRFMHVHRALALSNYTHHSQCNWIDVKESIVWKFAPPVFYMHLLYPVSSILLYSLQQVDELARLRVNGKIRIQCRSFEFFFFSRTIAVVTNRWCLHHFIWFDLIWMN